MDDRARFEEFARLATEQRNPRTMDLDTLEVPDLLARISAEDRTVPDAVAKELPYGTVTVNAVKGGLEIPAEQGTDSIVIANAAVIVSFDDDKGG